MTNVIARTRTWAETTLPDVASRRSTRTIVFGIIVGLLLFAQIAVLAQSWFVNRVWEDEAFNLTVPLNLLRGLGYTSDGTLSGSELTPFDVRISTGPVVLLPIALVIATGLDPALAGRLVIVLFYAALIAGLWMLGRMIGGRWAGLAAAATPLAFKTYGGTSAIQGPTDILGEVPTAALLVWAIYFMRSRPWLAGLLVGLAIQAKFIALLVIPVFALAVFFALPAARAGGWKGRLKRVLPAAGFAILPTALFELSKLVTLGINGYIDNLREFRYFLLSGGQPDAGTTPLEKLTAMLGAWYLPVWLVVILVIVSLGMIGFAGWIVWKNPDRLFGATHTARRPLGIIGALALLALLTWYLWWASSAHLPLWIRHPSPALFAFVPVMVAFVVLAIQIVFAEKRLLFKALAVVTAAGVATALATSVTMHTVYALTPTNAEKWADQRAIATQVKELDLGEVRGWWGAAVSVAVLSDVHSGLYNSPETAGRPVLWDGVPKNGVCEGMNQQRFTSNNRIYTVCTFPTN